LTFKKEKNTYYKN